MKIWGKGYRTLNHRKSRTYGAGWLHRGSDGESGRHAQPPLDTACLDQAPDLSLVVEVATREPQSAEGMKTVQMGNDDGERVMTMANR